MINANLVQHLDEVIAEYDKRSGRDSDSLCDQPVDDMVRLKIRGASAIKRIVGANSPHAREVDKILSYGNVQDWAQAQEIFGVAKALKADIAGGYLKTFEELIHGSVFADFLEMADYLLDEGYKDAAAVIAGSTLESHLRQLCIKHGVATTHANRPKKADTVNADLVKVGAYTLLDQKNVTAWLDLRNKAAHGDYTKYSPEQVKLFISSIRDFITRVPA